MSRIESQSCLQTLSSSLGLTGYHTNVFEINPLFVIPVMLFNLNTEREREWSVFEQFHIFLFNYCRSSCCLHFQCLLPLPGWSGQLCWSKHCSVLSALLPEPSVSSFKGSALSPQTLPAFCVGCWYIGLAATLASESFLETQMLILYGSLLDKMSNLGGRQLLSTLHQILCFASLLCTGGLAGRSVLPLCAACSSE